MYQQFKDAIERVLPTDSPIELLVVYAIACLAMWFVHRPQGSIKRDATSLLIFPVLVTAWAALWGFVPEHISMKEALTSWAAYGTMLAYYQFGRTTA